MKKLFILSYCFMMVLATNGQSLNVMSFNIRLNTSADSLNAWPYRKEKVNSQILFHEPHIIGVQEALYDQMLDMQEGLPCYRYVGGARDDGKKKGEFSAIFYDTTRLMLEETQTFWLSETPLIPGSKSWDAAITRIVTWGSFTDRKSNKKIYVFNTHFDHLGKEARKQSAMLLLKKINEIAGKNFVILTGDFNAGPQEDPIKILTNIKDQGSLSDTRELSLTPHYGPDGSFNGFGSRETDNYPIDYIFIKNGGMVLKHANLSQTWEGRFSSDHFPVYAILVY